MDPKLHSASAFTDPNGRWAFDGLPPGRYVVGVNLLEPPTISSPYPRTFYTAGTETREATPVDVVDGQQVQLDLRVGPRLATCSVSGVVLDEKETPVRAPTSSFPMSSFPLRPAPYARHADEHGRFSVLALEGRSYLVRARLIRASGTWLLGRSVFHKPSGSTQTAMSSSSSCGWHLWPRSSPTRPRCHRGKGILG